MNLLDLAVKITCDDQASGKVEGIGSKIIGTLGTAAKAGIAAIGGLVTATAGIGGVALNAYADYEQLVGGIDTLFGGASAKMQQYAAQAYQTAGTSANKYMEISTSFAASLISSLGGDTQKAADMANMAIQDMSDNANKMGTSLDVVQEAYQSLARGNYEMLDSLKLGYGGTKEQLEQLLDDAEDIAAAQGEVRDFSVDSYADIVEAIHLVQDEMGITGTTAEEAANTISGSINMASAAWENWLAGLGNENADMSALTSQLLDSIGAVAQNVGPRVGEIIGTLITEIVNHGPEIAAALGSTISSAFGQAMDLAAGIVGENTLLPTIEITADASQVQSALEQLQGAVSWLQGVFAPVLEPMAGAFQTVFSAVSSGLGTFGSNIQSLVVPAIEQLSPIFQSLFETIQAAEPVLTLISNIFGVVLASAISVAVQIFGLLVQGVTGLLQIMQGLYDFIAGFVTGVVTFFTVTLPTGITALITWFSQLPGQIMAFLSGLLASIGGWVASMASNAVSAGSQFVSNVVSFISSLPGQIAGFLGGVISSVASWVGQMASNAANAASQFASNLISGLQSIPGQVVSIGSQIIQGMVDGVLGAAQGLIDAVGGAVNNAIGFAKGLLGIASPSKVFREFGQFTMQGMALGIDDDSDIPVQSIDDAMRRMEAVPMTSARSTPSTSRHTMDDVVAAVDSLHEDLGRIISRYAPTATPREFRSAVRSVVA